MKPSRTDRAWMRWGETNPYHGVLMGFETSQMADQARREAFFHTGHNHITDVISRVNEAMGGFKNKDSALDFGCGVGRLLGPLAAEFRRVVGVDISPDMRALARKNTEMYPGVHLEASLAPLMLRNERFDLVHTIIVLQHINPAQGMNIIEELLDLVRVGGVFHLHFTIGDSRHTRRMLNWFRYRCPPLHWGYNIVRGRPWTEPTTEMHEYDIHSVLMLAANKGARDVLVYPSDEAGHRGVTLVGRICRPDDRI